MAMKSWYATVMFVVMIASNFTETSALPDCLRLSNSPRYKMRSVEASVMSRNKHLTEIIRAHRHNTMPTMAVKSRVMVAAMFAAWVVALNVVLA